MSRIFISGSSAGLGLMAAQLLIDQGHEVIIHARSAGRAADAKKELPHAAAVVVGDLETIAGAKDVAAQVNALGAAPPRASAPGVATPGVTTPGVATPHRFDAVIHNAAVGYREPQRLTSDGLPHLFAINTLSAYILTALIERPKRLVYLSSGMHHHAEANLDDILWKKRRWNGSTAYAESKLHDTMLAFAIARRWPEVFSNALEPGWVPTKMGGAGAPDDMDQGHRTQVWLASGSDPKADVTGEYFYHLKHRAANPQAHDAALQDRLIEICATISGVPLP